MPLPEHGGQLRAAVQAFNRPIEQWLDLSTAINPLAWPIPPLPASCWQRLPEPDDGLMEAATAYYGTRNLVACAGSQQAIQILPELRPRGTVAVLAPTYNEHAHCWQQTGHAVSEIELKQADAVVDAVDVLVCVNPNNPTGVLVPRARLNDWWSRLQKRGGWLVVDEAFADADSTQSLISEAGLPGLVVLRSVGKFFGLAGARVGFLAAWAELAAAFRARVGPWPVAHPSREIVWQALLDVEWQAQARSRLFQDSRKLAELLAGCGLPPAGGTVLFQWCPNAAAGSWYRALAQRGVLVRLFEHPKALRFALPGTPTSWRRLAQALEEVAAVCPT
ncbi:MAG: threonine-phosphate decarboxylase CobD [Pseudomonadota bacterium]|nr:threonine-phosphate decarboxylase CobD [Pseudomonadota bacterium]